MFTLSERVLSLWLRWDGEKEEQRAFLSTKELKARGEAHRRAGPSSGRVLLSIHDVLVS